MWWERPLLVGQRAIFPDSQLVEVVARSFAVVEVGGVRGLGPERGRAFERVFYSLCERRGVRLAERAGARTVGGQQSASRLPHEVDGATHSPSYLSHWELKHLTTEVPKNELLIFNGKGLDFLYGSQPLVASTPTFRFLLSGGSVRNECRIYAVLWGINIIEPGRLPLSLLCEAAARGAAGRLTAAEIEVVADRARWACRDLQTAIRELSQWADRTHGTRRFGSAAATLGMEILDVQEQIGASLLDSLEETDPDWLDELAEDTWRLVGGW